MISNNGYPGLYVVLDSIIGGGKTAIVNRWKEVLSSEFPNIKTIFTYEPGGNPEADIIRQKVKFEQMTGKEEVYWYVESRKITLPQIVRPALEKGYLVISDRSFTTSLDYQGLGRGLGMDYVWEVNKPVVQNTFPDVLVLPRPGFDVSLQRSRGKDPDKFDEEKVEFMMTCFDGYPQMVNFLKEISSRTEVVQVDDPEGKLNIEQMGKAIESKLYPMINRWQSEGGIVRERG